MPNPQRPEDPKDPEPQGFFASLLQGLIRDTAMLWISVLIGTVMGAALCLYLGLPLGFALLGGVLVLAVFAAWNTL